MQFRTAVLWSIVRGEDHPSLLGEEKQIRALMPLVDALFPGINYFSITGFGEVMRRCLIPTLQKRFPELYTMPPEAIDPEATSEVTGMLASDGYEWQDSQEWRARFEALLAAA